MGKAVLLSILVPSFAFSASHSGAAQQGAAALDRAGEEIIALERSALDRWITPDPEGYLNLYAPEVTYFDPTTEKRIDGYEALRNRLAPMKNVKIPASDRRYEMLEPKVQNYGDVAVLTYNLVNYGKIENRPEAALSRWNATEVYRRIDGKWRIVHSHFSFLKPELKPAGGL